ncbi:DUF4268 domain-containing protein [Rubrobacter marinus]|uniref:DUF4268 domain-containing protein n=1 Tax=Rubrobacter marinus TaxID=2653852 RepID=A0A6G8PV16_9ACTN|nr:DUF4268 domain-containing protein [Rubrobacter marinus]QIN78035.1 DUF4268 domain-containing protein [Rubrobacter marinus]
MIGRLKKVPVGEMYGSGGSNFTAWLQENLDVLNDAAGISLSGVQDEGTASPAGIVARDPSGGAVVIENEPGESGDVGLGKLLTSLASVRATTGVWIVSDARPEHLAAVSWMNEMSRAALYLLKVEAFRIDDSPPAPMMTLISGPAPEAVPVGTPGAPSAPTPLVGEPDAPVATPAGGHATDVAFGEAPPAVSAAEAEEASAAGGVATQAPPVARDTTGLVLYQFWTELLEKATERTRLHAEVEPTRERSVGAGAGVAGLSYNYFVGEHDAGVELFIHRGEERRSENDLVFNALQATEDAISYNFGAPLDWQRAADSSARRVRYPIHDAGYADDEAWPELQDQMIDAMIRLEKAMRPHVSRLQL